MEITTTTMGMVGTMGVPTRDFRHAALRSMTEREMRQHLPARSRKWRMYLTIVDVLRIKRGMLKATQPTTIQDAILRAGILTDDVISCGTLSKSNEKRKVVEETGKSGGS
ncbi:hypothetical protein Tco_0366474 [Tanacetum coccineum]